MESTTAAMKRGLWAPSDELEDDPDTCDWALDDTLTPEGGDVEPVIPAPHRPRRGVWLVAGGVVVGVPVVLLAMFAVAVATGGVLAWTFLEDGTPRSSITTLP